VKNKLLAIVFLMLCGNAMACWYCDKALPKFKIGDYVSWQVAMEYDKDGTVIRSYEQCGKVIAFRTASNNCQACFIETTTFGVSIYYELIYGERLKKVTKAHYDEWEKEIPL
jgi:hypothetical protein